MGMKRASDQFGEFYKSKPGWVYHHRFWMAFILIIHRTVHGAGIRFFFGFGCPKLPTHMFYWKTSVGVLSKKKITKSLAYDFVAEKWHMLDELIPKASDTFEERMEKIKNSFMSDSNKRNAIANYLLTGR